MTEARRTSAHDYIVSQGDRRWIVYLPEGTISELPSRSCLPPKGAA